MDLLCDDQATIYGVVGELNTKNLKQKDNHLIVGHTACISCKRYSSVLTVGKHRTTKVFFELGRDEY